MTRRKAKAKAITTRDTINMWLGLIAAAFWLSLPFVVILVLFLLLRVGASLPGRALSCSSCY